MRDKRRDNERRPQVGRRVSGTLLTAARHVGPVSEDHFSFVFGRIRCPHCGQMELNLLG